MTDSWVNIGRCSCTDTCARWVINEDGSGGFFAPYVPEDTNECKKLHHFLGKDIKPTIKKNA